MSKSELFRIKIQRGESVDDRPQVSKQLLIELLEKLRSDMNEIGVIMEYYGGMAEYAKHGKELINAARYVDDWIEEIKL